MARYLCLCGEETDSQTKLPKNKRPPNLQRLLDLYFCPKCHAFKCIHCCTVSVVCKYCPSCMSDYTDNPGLTRCTKNCFLCPECFSSLEIEIHDLERDSCKGKTFGFSCVYCPYSYQTRFVSKPASLTTILKQERPLFFSLLHEKYSLRHKLLNAGKNHMDKKKPRAKELSPETVVKMQQLKVSPKDEQASLAYRMDQIEPRPIDIDRDFRSISIQKLPIGHHLSAKKSYSCNVCKSALSVPVADPRLMKYMTKELAPDIAPMVTVKRNSSDESRQGASANKSADSTSASEESPFAKKSAAFTGKADPDTSLDSLEPGTLSCTLSIVNPLSVSMNVTVSTLKTAPDDNLELLSRKTSLILPETSFIIGPRQEKTQVLDAVPTAYLTDATSSSRAEKLTRAIRRDKNSTVQKGFNWVSVPLKVLDCTEDVDCTEDIKVAVYVTVETRAPEAWVVSGKCKKSLKFGFWTVCDVSYEALNYID